MQALHDFLCDHFKPAEFERMALLNHGFGAGDRAIRHDLPPSSSTERSTYFMTALELLQRHDALGRRFFSALRRARPNSRAHINRLEKRHQARARKAANRLWPALPRTTREPRRRGDHDDGARPKQSVRTCKRAPPAAPAAADRTDRDQSRLGKR